VVNKKLDHIGIAVKDLNASVTFYCNLLNLEEVHRETLDTDQICVCYLENKNDPTAPSFELISAISENSAISKFLQKRGEGIHHLGYQVENLNEAIEDFKTSGAEMIENYPKTGSKNKTVVFFKPHSTNGILIELCYS
jgi:methylmalonyl-CoA/ethylmalonyl-CoA epimerase